MFCELPFWKLRPYWRAVPRSDVHWLLAFAPTFWLEPVTVSCFGWLVLKITVLAAVVAEETVFSPTLVGAKRNFQPIAASSADCAADWVVPPGQSEACCKQPLVMSYRLLSPTVTGGEADATMAGVIVP